MEPKQYKILLGGVIFSVVASVGALAFAFVSYQTIAARNGERPSIGVVDLGPVSFTGFAGKPTSATVTSFGGEKTIELKGHTLKDPKSSYESVSNQDTAKKKIIIDPNTKIYAVEFRGNQAPKVSTIEFNQFTTASTTEVYIASYEAGEGMTITESTPASAISMFSGK
jgi:hypothetical protein